MIVLLGSALFWFKFSSYYLFLFNNGDSKNRFQKRTNGNAITRSCETGFIPKNQSHKINLGKTAQNQYKLKPSFTIQCWGLFCVLLWWPEAQKTSRCGSSYKSSKGDNVVFKLVGHMKILNSAKEGTLKVGSKHDDMWVCCVDRLEGRSWQNQSKQDLYVWVSGSLFKKPKSTPNNI